MKQVLVIVLLAAIVSGIVVQTYRMADQDDATEGRALIGATSDNAGNAAPATSAAVSAPTLNLTFTDALPEDVWVNGARQAGDDHRVLTNSSNSICYITKMEISGARSADDTSSCALEIDDFTGFWDLIATVEEGGQSQIRCNARCLVWE